MRHIGRVHGVSVQWMNERLGEHVDRDNVYLFYQDTNYMSADIYTKAFTVEANWRHACQLISVHTPDELTPEWTKNWLDERRQHMLHPDANAERTSSGWSKSSRSRSSKKNKDNENGDDNAKTRTAYKWFEQQRQKS